MSLKNSKLIKTKINKLISDFEHYSTNSKGNMNNGIAYTPHFLADFMVKSALMRLNHTFLDSRDILKEKYELSSWKEFFQDHESLKEEIANFIIKIKILDPSYGSGRLLYPHHQ